MVEKKYLNRKFIITKNSHALVNYKTIFDHISKYISTLKKNIHVDLINKIPIVKNEENVC